MTAYLGGPPWPVLDAALARPDLAQACELAEQSPEIDVAERRLVVGICRSFFHQPDQASEALIDSFHAVCRDRRRSRAALSAVFIGRLNY